MVVNVNGIYYVHVCEQERWARSAGNSSTENVCTINIKTLTERGVFGFCRTIHLNYLPQSSERGVSGFCRTIHLNYLPQSSERGVSGFCRTIHLNYLPQSAPACRKNAKEKNPLRSQPLRLYRLKTKRNEIKQATATTTNKQTNNNNNNNNKPETKNSEKTKQQNKQRVVGKRCSDSIKVILCRSMLCRIVFCLADFIFSVYFGLKLTY